MFRGRLPKLGSTCDPGRPLYQPPNRVVSGFDIALEREPVRRFEVINGAGGRRTRSTDAKARILEETLAPGAVVSEMARRHGLTPQ